MPGFPLDIRAYSTPSPWLSHTAWNHHIVLDKPADFPVQIRNFFAAKFLKSRIYEELVLKNHWFFTYFLFLFFFLSACGQPYHSANTLGTDPTARTSGYGKFKSGIGKASSIPGACEMPSDGRKPVSVDRIQPTLDEALDFCDAAQEFWQKGQLDAAIEALDEAYSLILNIDDTGASPQLSQQKEDIRFMISKRILEIYASRNVAIKGNYNEIPLVMNKHVQAEIDLFTKGAEHDFFINSYVRSGRYRDRIVQELKAAGLPEELSWLPLIESGFKENAFSPARALGLWQFIPTTGYKFGLNRDEFVDERLDPEKSTRAAIEYFKEMHQMFGDWSTVLAGYNCGEGRVLKEIRTQNIDYLDHFWDLYEKLPQETARYVPRFLATLHIVKNPKKFGITLPQPEKPLKYETLKVSKQVHLKDIAAKIGISENELKQLNPELRYNILPDENYDLKVPPKKSRIVLAALREIPVTETPRQDSTPATPKAKKKSPAFIQHRVKSGETLLAIANRYSSSVKDIKSANGIKRSNNIIVGTNLKIPLEGSVSPAFASAKERVIKKKTTQYTVESGDSLYIIANRFNTTTKKIQAMNKMTSTRVAVGQKLKIPSDSDSASIQLHSTYIVKCGDSPHQIAQKHRMTLSRLMSLNKLTPSSKIFPGQQLVVE
jgi:membrane-bound lytic murein transglycosylase D